MNPDLKTSTPPVNPEKASKASTFKNLVWEWVKVIVVALILAWIIRSFIIEPFVVEGASMDPTFSTGQYLIVDRISYRFETPKRGDVIVFQYPNDPRLDYIKRIIGLPGEEISINNGVTTIKNSEMPNGFTLDESYVTESHKSYTNVTSLKLGPTQYFVMGDNRAFSSDSRAWGPLDSSLIIGRPIARLWPVSILPGESAPIASPVATSTLKK